MTRKTITIEEVIRTYDKDDNIVTESRRPVSVTDVPMAATTESVPAMPRNNLRD